MDFEVVNVVVFPSGNHPVYDVELCSPGAVEALVREFFKYTRRRDPVQRPAELDRVSIHHSVTPGTRVRIALLRVSIFHVPHSCLSFSFISGLVHIVC